MYFILITLFLVVGYVGILTLEARRSTRYLAAYRARFDEVAGQAHFVITHIDFRSLARDEAIRAIRYAFHEVAHAVLQGVRAAERLLTRLVRRLRLHPEVGLPGSESARHFVRTLSEFKVQLEATRPEMPEIR